jgi:hypothetical protein
MGTGVLRSVKESTNGDSIAWRVETPNGPRESRVRRQTPWCPSHYRAGVQWTDDDLEPELVLDRAWTE